MSARISCLVMPSLVTALAALGCGASRFEVPSYPHPDGAPVEVVGFMPPPAQVEHLDSKPPAQGCLWADGQWIWAAQRWDWRPGSWIRPPEGCRYSPPTVQWTAVPSAPSGSRDEASQQGVLYYRPGRWYSVGEPKACPETVICPTESPVPQSLAPPAPAPPAPARPGPVQPGPVQPEEARSRS